VTDTPIGEGYDNFFLNKKAVKTLVEESDAGAK
jgi:hypothetical protein